MSVLLYDCTTWTLMKQLEKKLDGDNKTAAVQPLTSHLTNHPRKASKTCRRLLEKHGLLHIDTSVLADQQNLTFISSVWTFGTV